MEEMVVLVDEHDNELGVMEKMEAHEKGVLHRAFSVFVFNQNDELMLQRRALHKYHSGGLWTNTCCSHPRPHEAVMAAGNRRLQEEMGMTAPLEEAFTFIYRAELDNNLTEHELDHVLVGRTDTQPAINPKEVDSWKYMSLQDVRAAIDHTPEAFTEWFKICFDQVEAHFTRLQTS
ncbi:MAG: isopentenyl-diphosphate Delta-isomerase [Flavobacteriales bacterium]